MHQVEEFVFQRRHCQERYEDYTEECRLWVSKMFLSCCDVAFHALKSKVILSRQCYHPRTKGTPRKPENDLFSYAHLQWNSLCLTRVTAVHFQCGFIPSRNVFITHRVALESSPGPLSLSILQLHRVSTFLCNWQHWICVFLFAVGPACSYSFEHERGFWPFSWSCSRPGLQGRGWCMPPM